MRAGPWRREPLECWMRRPGRTGLRAPETAPSAPRGVGRPFAEGAGGSMLVGGDIFSNLETLRAVAATPAPTTSLGLIGPCNSSTTAPGSQGAGPWSLTMIPPSPRANAASRRTSARGFRANFSGVSAHLAVVPSHRRPTGSATPRRTPGSVTRAPNPWRLVGSEQGQRGWRQARPRESDEGMASVRTAR